MVLPTGIEPGQGSLDAVALRPKGCRAPRWTPSTRKSSLERVAASAEGGARARALGATGRRQRGYDYDPDQPAHQEAQEEHHRALHRLLRRSSDDVSANYDLVLDPRARRSRARVWRVGS